MEGGAIGKIRDGDLIRLDAVAGRLDVLVERYEWNARVYPRKRICPPRKLVSVASSSPCSATVLAAPTSEPASLTD